MSSSIEETFQPPEWATKEEVIKAAQHYINYWKIEAKHRNSQWLETMADNARLKAEVEAYHVASVHTCSRGCQKPGCPRKYLDEIDRLKAEVERLEQKHQQMIEFICQCVAKGNFKAFKNGSVKFGNAVKEGKSKP